MTDLRIALRALNSAAHEALKAALAHPDPYGRGAVWLRLRVIADDTDRMVDETAPKIDWPSPFTRDLAAADAEYRKQGTTLFQAEYMQQPIFDDETAPNTNDAPEPAFLRPPARLAP